MIMTWPAGLPRPERNSWQLSRQDGRQASQGDVGPVRYRRRISRTPLEVQMSVVLDRDQRAVFDRFYDDDCAGGVRLFRMPDPATDGWALLASDGNPLLAPDGSPLLLSALWLCAWGKEGPVEAVIGVEFRKNFSLQVLR